jgi:transglutaminase-like putative cysteine protease
MNSIDVNQFTLKTISDAGTDEERIRSIYYFVRDEVKFDMVENQFMSSAEVLRIRRGACMNKALLFHDMVNALGIPVRLHFMRVSKKALEDLLHPVVYRFWPDSFLHTYPEVNIKGNWTSIEPTFDRELHEALLRKKLNFARTPAYRNISIEFDIRGVRGAQQFTEIPGSRAEYASNLDPLKKSMEEIAAWKMKLQPMMFRWSSRWINTRVRA